MHVIVIDTAHSLAPKHLQSRFPDITFHHCVTFADLDVAAAHNPVASFGVANDSEQKQMQRRAYELESMQLCHVGGSGYDQLLPLDRPNVVVTNCVGVLARYLAETVTGAMLALNGHFFTYRQQQAKADWTLHPFAPIEGQTMLVVGLGAIGACVAQNAKALGMRVIAIRRTQTPQPHVDEMAAPDALHAKLAEADVVSVHLRHNAETHHTFDAAAFAAMKPGSLFLNTSRGPIVDTTALMDALKDGKPRAAYLDVFEEEPLPSDHPLWQMEQVFMTPHTADNIHNYVLRFADVFAENLDRLRAGRTDWVNPVTS